LSKREKSSPPTHPNLEFEDCISITFEHQKREEKHNTVTEESLGDSVLCSVWFAATLVRCIWSYKGTDSSTQVTAYIRNGVVEHVTSTQVINALGKVVGVIGKNCLGVAKQEMGTYSIRSEAAMAMYLGKCAVYTIMFSGQWSSKCLLMLHLQTGHANQPQCVKEDAALQELPAHSKLQPQDSG
jgi:hypothetical protein